MRGSQYGAAMERGILTFTLVVLLLPALLFVVAALVHSYALLLVLIGLAVLVTGFTLALSAIDA